MPFRFLTLFLISLMICGCSGEANLPAVTGKVTIDGVPLKRGSISLRPVDPACKDEPYATIEADGTFKVMTKNRPGSPKGKFAVLLTAYEDIDPNNPSAAPKSLIPKRYAQMDKPAIHIEVPSANYDLSLSSKP